jgi:hypothetical protein
MSTPNNERPLALIIDPLRGIKCVELVTMKLTRDREWREGGA